MKKCLSKVGLREEKNLKIKNSLKELNKKKINLREIKCKRESVRSHGISLIALVITIIVLLILAGVTIATLTGENGIITRASESALATELAKYKEALELYKVNKIQENGEFIEETLTAGKTDLNYNTKAQEETGNIKTILTDISDKYFEKLEVIKGKLLINTRDKSEIRIAQSLGIEVNPYDIRDGVLWSSDGNLLLMDENTGSLTIPDSVTAIGEGAFANLEGLKTIIIPPSVKRIEQNAFSNNTTLENVIIQVRDGQGCEYIGDRAFFTCSNLKNINLPDSITYIGAAVFRNDRKLESIKLPNELKTLKLQTFYGCTNLKNIDIAISLEIMEYESLFATSITKLELPPNLKDIGDRAIAISKLQEIDTSKNNYYEYKNGVLYTKDLKTLVMALPNTSNVDIENSVENIKMSAFQYCVKLETINIPENVKTIGAMCFYNDALKKISVSPNNNYFKNDENGNLYSKDGTMLYRLFDTGNVTIKTGVENIQRGALLDNKKISTLTLPESYIGDKMNDAGIFPNLDYLLLPKNTKIFNKNVYFNIVTIEVAEDNSYFKSINNEYIVSKDGTELYWTKSDLPELNIPDTVKVIKAYAFCYQITEKIILPNSVTKVEEASLYYSIVKKIEIQSNIEAIASDAFKGANSLQEVIIHKKKNEISGSPWGNPYGDRAIIWDN